MYKSALLLVALMAPGIALSQNPPEAQANPAAAPAPGKRNPFSSKITPAAPLPVAVQAVAPLPVAAPFPQIPGAIPVPPKAPVPAPTQGIQLGPQDDGRVFIGIVGNQVLYRTKDDSYVLQPHHPQ